MSESEIIDYYYTRAVSGIDENWFNNTPHETWYNYIINLPDKERTAYLISILDTQINNGGFNQYFINGYGQFSLCTINALETIKAENIRKLLSEAYKKVNSHNFESAEFRRKLLLGEIEELYEDESLDDYLDSLDTIYYKSTDNIGELLSIFLSNQAL